MSSIAYSGSGGLFTELGLIISTINNVLGLIGTQDPDASSDWGSGADDVSIHTIDNRIAALDASFTDSFDELKENLWEDRDAYYAVHSSYLSRLRTKAEQVIIKHVDNESKLSSLTLAAALPKLIAYMAATVDNESVQSQSVSVAVAAGSANVGDPIVMATLLDVDGTTKQYPLAEVIDVTVSSVVTAGSETFGFQGQRAATDSLTRDWPLGSGASSSFTAADPTSDSSINLLTNSDFDAFTSNLPDKWATITGSAGTNFLEEATTVYRTGGKSLEFVSDVSGAATLSKIAQTFGDATNGTAATLQRNKLYAVSMRLRASAALSQGAISAFLYNSSNALLTDDQGVDLQIDFPYTAFNHTAWTAVSGWFAMPKNLPTSGVKLVLGFDTGNLHDNAESIFVDDLSLVLGSELYSGGPTVAVATGATAVTEDDVWTATVSNDYSALWQKELERLFGLRQRGLTMRHTSSPTIAQTLITD